MATCATQHDCGELACQNGIDLIRMFYACHYHDHAKASVMHAQAGCFLSKTLLDDDIMLLYAYN